MMPSWIEGQIVTDVLNVKKREETGTARMRRLRAAGMVPAVLYGQGTESQSLVLNAREVDAAIRHGSHVVELKGDLNASAILKAVQWDPVGNDVLHLDLTRFDADEKVEVNMTVELRGEAPGAKANGILKHHLHELSIACLATNMPDSIEVNINELDVNQSITVGELQLPEGVSIVGCEDSDIVVSCNEPAGASDSDEPADFSAAEPEVIGRAAADDEEQAGG